MNLSDIYNEGGRNALNELAEAAGVNPVYLWQLATRWNGRRPSARLADKLIAVDRRLTYEDLMRPSENTEAA